MSKAIPDSPPSGHSGVQAFEMYVQNPLVGFILMVYHRLTGCSELFLCRMGWLFLIAGKYHPKLHMPSLLLVMQ
jgi:hypothetical protein